MSRSVAILAVVPWVVALGSVLAVRWQTRRVLAEIAAVGEATRAELSPGLCRAPGGAARVGQRPPRGGGTPAGPGRRASMRPRLVLALLLALASPALAGPVRCQTHHEP